MPATRVTNEIKEALMKYLDEHKEDIKYAHKGYIQAVKNAFEEESGYKLSACQFGRLLEYYRIAHNCPIEYVPNKYYKPKRSYCVSRYRNPTEQ